MGNWSDIGSAVISLSIHGMGMSMSLSMNISMNMSMIISSMSTSISSVRIFMNMNVIMTVS